ncbi:hypothetical protein GPECTOR_55g284 [Gonium pectorale]|uniref:O-fucosyltransferase family protein n=1 Tax=Gonium pectorale TaxID=33097 RepID=A0A150G6C4_GONPE|nr:hypothetical protein GPECTOR_55g284 [Gonium pectorale]|eukprot:KXZ45378.1 hypothetical protein GPECTOR_55g284 [Gonium pectorale]
MWLLRVAMAHRKILIVDWTSPAPITNFLLPNYIDWTANGLDKVGVDIHRANDLDDATFDAAVYEGRPDAVERLRNTKLFTIMTNQHFYINTMKDVPPVNYTTKLEAGSCHYHFLFKLNQTIVTRGEQHLMKLYGSTTPPYVAWHWRHFDADGREEQPVLLSHLGAALQCAESLGDGVGIDVRKQPVMLVTDFNVMRHLVLRGRLAQVVTPNITARHLDKPVVPVGVDPKVAAALDTFTDIFVDLYLLSRARCLLTSRSGFSKMALWMGGGGGKGPILTCHRDMIKCEEEIVWRRQQRRQLRRGRVARRALLQLQLQGAA